ncbi:MAG: cardiolipin synthase [Bacillota bacterium]|nr:cardiolipin synthase [Bacillota bacterium]
MSKKIVLRIIGLLPAVFLQILWFILLLTFLSNYIELLSVIVTILSFFFVLYLISAREETSYKIMWLLITLTLPFVGAVLYLLWGRKSSSHKMKKKLDTTHKELLSATDKAYSAIDEIYEEDKRVGQIFHVLEKVSGFPTIQNENAKYYPVGEDMLKDMLVDLENAKEYIYLEYFIVEAGQFWDSLVEVMIRKLKEGVDVRVMYDDIGSIATYSREELEHLIKSGIRCIPFNPAKFLTMQLNNRDHRKIMVIDGEIAYSGGINIADEYINEKDRFGHWKDIGFRLTGNAVLSYQYMFVEFWNAFSEDKIAKVEFIEKQNKTHDGYILPYYDAPFFEQACSNNLYIQMLNAAEDYIWFYTPYLILGDSLTDAFVAAAQRGVDVRIVVPGIPDKELVYRITRSYYGPLLEAGVKIYEYTPGFLHAKACICDDKLATIGTVNLDYRSLFLHFECNSLFYKASIIDVLKEDFEDTISKSKERTLADQKTGFIHFMINGLLRIISPLC